MKPLEIYAIMAQPNKNEKPYVMGVKIGEQSLPCVNSKRIVINMFWESIAEEEKQRLNARIVKFVEAE